MYARREEGSIISGMLKGISKLPNKNQDNSDHSVSQMSRSELLSLINEYHNRQISESHRNGVTVWALISGVIVISAYIAPDLPVIFHREVATVLVSLILFVEVVRDILKVLQTRRVRITGVMDLSGGIQNLHYACVMQMAKWVFILGLAKFVIGESPLILTIYVFSKVLLMTVSLIMYDVDKYREYAKTIAFGSGNIGDISGHIKALLLTITIITLSEHFGMISWTDLKACVGIVLVLYAIQHIAGKVLNIGTDNRLNEVERAVLTGELDVASATVQVSNIVFGKKSEDVITEEYEKYMNSIDYIEDQKVVSPVVYIHAWQQAKILMKKLNNARKYDPNAVRDCKKKVYILLGILEMKSSKHD